MILTISSTFNDEGLTCRLLFKQDWIVEWVAFSDTIIKLCIWLLTPRIKFKIGFLKIYLLIFIIMNFIRLLGFMKIKRYILRNPILNLILGVKSQMQSLIIVSENATHSTIQSCLNSNRQVKPSSLKSARNR